MALGRAGGGGCPRKLNSLANCDKGLAVLVVKFPYKTNSIFIKNIQLELGPELKLIFIKSQI